MLALTGPAAAADKKRVGVPKFEGAQEGVIRKRVMQVLKGEGYELVKSKELEAAAQTAGASLDSNDGFMAVAKELSLSAFVTGEVGKKKAKLTVRNGADGSVSGEGSFAGANPRKIAAEIGKSFTRRLGSAVERGKVPAGAKKPTKPAVAEAPEDNEDAPEAAGDDDSGDKDTAGGDKDKTASEGGAGASKKKKKDDAAEAEEAAGPAGALSPWLEVAIGPRVFSRNLTYNQDVNRALRQYQLKAGPAVAFDVITYPLGLLSRGPLENLGAELHIEQAFGISSTVGANPASQTFPQGGTFPTAIHDYGGGVRYRIQLAPSAQLAVLGGGGEHAFSFRSGANSPRSMLDIPDTIYRYVRAGLQGRVEVAPGFSILVGGAYRVILNKGGQIQTQFFPHLTVGGIDAEVMLAYRVLPKIEVRLGGELRRYFYSMHARMGDTYLAGGAVDQYLSGTIQAAFLLGGDR